MSQLAYEKELEVNLQKEYDLMNAIACPDCKMTAEMCGMTDYNNGDTSVEYLCLECKARISVKRGDKDRINTFHNERNKNS